MSRKHARNGGMGLPLDRQELMFPWRDRMPSRWRMLGAFSLSLLFFTVLLTTVRVRISPTNTWIERKASVIQIPAGAEGREWSLKALEGGPFPTRFEPSDWPGITISESTALKESAAARPAYQPELRDLPSPPPSRVTALTDKGERFFPPSPQQTQPPTEPKAWKTVPVLYAASNLPEGSLPDKLPPFPNAIDAKIMAEPWRFMIRLQPGGGVADCLPLNGADRPGAAELEAWVRLVRFPSALSTSHPWITVDVGFLNQPDHGPDPR
jgi:hypothetical protein